MKTTNRIARQGNAARNGAQAKHNPAKSGGTPPRKTKRPADDGPAIGSFIEGNTVHTLHQRGRRFIHAIHHIDRLIGGVWKPVPDKPDLETKVFLTLQFDAIIERIRQRKGLALPTGREPVRERIERQTLSYEAALLLVRERILFPAIHTSIPSCMDRDLWASVYMNLPAGRNRAEEKQQHHVVGATTNPIPPGYTIGRDGVFRRGRSKQ
jgi:hypothetical protein